MGTITMLRHVMLFQPRIRSSYLVQLAYVLASGGAGSRAQPIVATRQTCPFGTLVQGIGGDTTRLSSAGKVNGAVCPIGCHRSGVTSVAGWLHQTWPTTS